MEKVVALAVLISSFAFLVSAQQDCAYTYDCFQCTRKCWKDPQRIEECMASSGCPGLDLQTLDLARRQPSCDGLRDCVAQYKKCHKGEGGAFCWPDMLRICLTGGDKRTCFQEMMEKTGTTLTQMTTCFLTCRDDRPKTHEVYGACQENCAAQCQCVSTAEAAKMQKAKAAQDALEYRFIGESIDMLKAYFLKQKQLD